MIVGKNVFDRLNFIQRMQLNFQLRKAVKEIDSSFGIRANGTITQTTAFDNAGKKIIEKLEPSSDTLIRTK